MTEFGIQKVAFNGGEIFVKGANKLNASYAQAGDTAIFKFEDKKPEGGVYSSMGLNLSEKAKEPQGAEEAKGGTSVNVGDHNGTTIIVIGNNNTINADGEKVEDKDKVKETENPDEVDETEDKDETKEPGEAEEPAETKPGETHNKTVIETLKEIIIKLLGLITGEKVEKEDPVKEEEPVEEVPGEEEPGEEKPVKEQPAKEQPAAPANPSADAEKIKTLKEVIVLLLGLVKAEEPAKEEPKEKAEDKDKDKKEETPKVAD